MNKPLDPKPNPKARVPHNEPVFSGLDPDGEASDAIWIKVAACIATAICLAVGGAYAARVVINATPAPVVSPPPAVAIEFTCPAPTRGGDVTSITFVNDGKTITTRCQLTRDWQLLNPRGQNIPRPEPK